MKKIDKEKKEFIKEIKTMKYGSIEEMILITLYSLISYLKSLIVFGKDSKATKDNLNFIKEIYDILKLENKLLNYILKQIHKIDINACSYVIEMLDSLNDQTIRYYYDLIDDIEIAAQMKNEFRALRANKTFPTLIQTYSYITEVTALGEDSNSLKNFLGFENEFWDYIQDKVETIAFSDDVQKNAKVEPIVKNNIVIDMVLKVPEIVNLQTSLLAIKIYCNAYELYRMLGCNYNKKAINDCNLQKKYYVEYLVNKSKRIFQLKNVM